MPQQLIQNSTKINCRFSIRSFYPLQHGDQRCRMNLQHSCPFRVCNHPHMIRIRRSYSERRREYWNRPSYLFLVRNLLIKNLA